jgi:hypothetical protein
MPLKTLIPLSTAPRTCPAFVVATGESVTGVVAKAGILNIADAAAAPATSAD